MSVLPYIFRFLTHLQFALKALKEESYSNCRYAKLHFHENSHFSEGVDYSEGDYQRKNAPSSISCIVHKV
jgi:hypothetical protein